MNTRTWCVLGLDGNYAFVLSAHESELAASQRLAQIIEGLPRNTLPRLMYRVASVEAAVVGARIRMPKTATE